MTDRPARIRADARTRSGRRRGQAMVETVVVMFALCLVFFSVYEYANVLTAHTVVNYAAARAARARTVGFNDFMVTKTVRVATASVAGKCRSHLYSGDLVFSKMEEVEIGGKTLYVVKTNIPELYDQDQYIEIYDDCYITYSVIGSELSTENKILNGVIGSLRTSAKAYPIPDAFIHDNNLGNYSVEVLSDYTVEEIEGGLHAKKKKVDLFVRYLHTDFLGALIYGRDDFLDRTERLTSYMAETLGVDSVDFWDEGTTEMINGKEFTVYEVMIGLKDGTY
ncbi:MAG: pilus assembly protein, partial [Kiritimatiellae bacterium]|nr:pilus assembly protein [Kiritimatiellia bacterium]